MTISATLVGGLAAAALPALMWRRLGPWLARTVAVGAVAAVAWVLWSQPRSDANEQIAPVTVIATAGVPGTDPAGTESSVGRSGDARTRPLEGARWVAAEGQVVEALVAERLRGESGQVAVAWTGPFEIRASIGAVGPIGAAGRVGEDGQASALTTVPAPRLDPTDVAVRLDAPLEVGRPAVLSVALEGTDAHGRPRAETLPDGFEVHLAVGDRDAGGSLPLVERWASTAELRSGPVELRFRPSARGPIRVQIEVIDTERRQRAEGRVLLEAGPPRAVAVVGEGAAELAAALAVQGVPAVAWNELPKPAATAARASSTPSTERAALVPAPSGEPSVGAVVLLDRPTPSQQERLLRFLRAGGGVFVVGSEDGGALPLPGEPLHDVLPVLFEPRASRPAGEGEGEESGDSKAEPSREQPPKPELPKPDLDPPATPPEIPPPTPPLSVEPPAGPPAGPPAEPEDAVRGGTDGAQLLPGPEVEVERRQVAMVLVVDRSASMGEPAGVYTKMDLAKRSALETAKALKRGDQLGVVSFGRTGVPVVLLTDASEIEHIETELEKLRATDRQTLVRNALEQALQMLEGSRAAVRHIVVISDGVIYDAGAIDHSAVLLAAEIKKRNITLSAILIGEMPAQTWVPQMTRLGGGKFYHSADAASLPRFVSVEVASALGRIGRQPVSATSATADPIPGGGGEANAKDPDAEDPAVRDHDRASASPDGATPERSDESPPSGPPEPRQPESEQPESTKPEPQQPDERPHTETEPASSGQDAAADRDNPRRDEGAEALPLLVTALVDSALLEPNTNGEFPPVFGVLEVRGRPDARTLLVAGDAGLPLLAVQNRGLGKIAAWTSGLTGGWGRAWRSDLHFPARLAQWVTHLLPPQDAVAADVLTMSWELVPPAPLRSEQAWLQQWAGADAGDELPMVANRSFEPTSRTEFELRPAATPLAPWVLGAIVLLALVECLVRRRFAI